MGTANATAPGRTPHWSLVRLQELPSTPHLTNLTCEARSNHGQDRISLRLLPGGGFQGVLGAGQLPLKRLRLKGCNLIDGPAVWAAIAANLPDLETLSLEDIQCGRSIGSNDIITPAEAHSMLFDAAAGMQQLTQYEVSASHGMSLWEGPGIIPAAALQHMQTMSQLVDLRLKLPPHCSISTSMLSSMHSLTRLELAGLISELLFEPEVLAGKPKLQHPVHLENCKPVAGSAAAGVAIRRRMQQLQGLQQLTHLHLEFSHKAEESFWDPEHSLPAAFSAVTASSRLEYLGISGVWLLPTVWQHTFPAGSWLPNLRTLLVSVPQGSLPSLAPAGCSLTSCCPALQLLGLHNVPSLQLLDRLQDLTGLQSLVYIPTPWCTDDWPWVLGTVCQLTTLRRLVRDTPTAKKPLCS
jgi:hypothetical protein